MFKNSLLTVLVFIQYCGVASAQDTSFLKTDSISLFEFATYFRDSSENMTIEQVCLAHKEGKFIPFESKSPLFSKKYIYWVAFSLQNNGIDTVTKVIHINNFRKSRLYSSIQNFEVAQQQAHYENFRYKPFLPMEFIYAIPIKIPPAHNIDYILMLDDRTLHLRMKGKLKKITLFNYSNFINFAKTKRIHIINYLIITGAFLITIAFLIVFTILQYNIHKEVAYLHYSFYLTFIFLFYIIKKSTVFNTPLTAFMEWREYLTPPFALAAGIAYLYFLQSFLDVSPKRYPHFSWIIWLLKLLISVVILLDLSIKLFISLEAGAIIFQFIKIILLLAGIYTIYLVYWVKDPLSKFIFTGTIVLVFGLISASINELFQYFFGFSLEVMQISYAQLGILLELLVFSTGLGYRTKIIRKEKTAAQDKLILQLQENDRLQSELNEKLAQEMITVELEKKLVEAELKAIKAQINPHFIFNSLNSIKDLIQKKNQEKALEYLTKFSKLLRMILYNSDKNWITLREEIELCKVYLRLESLRFNNNFEFLINCPAEIGWVKIPPLTLQPLIENAVWHGLLPQKHQKCWLRIDINLTNGRIKVVIEDNGIGPKKTSTSKGNSDLYKSMGLELVRERLGLKNQLPIIKITDKSDIFEESQGAIVELTFENQEPIPSI